jgi:hypothetical protein
MEFLHQLYPDKTKDELERMQQLLRLQAIIKSCQYGENLAAFVIAFLSTYDDENQEMLGMFNKISRYGIREIIGFYKNMIKRKNDYVAKFYGYPPLNLQFPKPRSFFELSCKNIKETLVEVGQLCIEFHEFYKVTKHGYRIFIGKDKNNAALNICALSF